MSSHIVDGEFQSDKYPTCPRGKVPLSVKDPTAQDLLWEYAQRRRSVDVEFSRDLEIALTNAGHVPMKCETCGLPLRFGTRCNSSPTDDDIQDADSGNVCVTCGASLP